MSAWTAVAGVVNCDNYNGLANEDITPAEHARTIVGRWHESYISDDSWHDAVFNRTYGGTNENEMPNGSEGPLKFICQSIDSKSSVNNLLITFHGNLRDYDDSDVTEQMIPWFKDLITRLQDSGIRIRNMAINLTTHSRAYLLCTKDDAEFKPQLVVTEIGHN